MVWKGLLYGVSVTVTPRLVTVDNGGSNSFSIIEGFIFHMPNYGEGFSEGIFGFAWRIILSK
jgi:hypothetical protein